MPTFFLDADTIDSSIPLVPIYGWRDSFDRANGVIGVTSGEGKVWQHIPLGTGALPGVIYSNCLTNADGPANSLMVVEAGSPDGVFKTQIAAVGTRYAGIAFRVQDASSYWRVVLRVTTTDFSYVLSKVTAGTAVPVYTSTIASAFADQIELRVVGSQVTMYVNGVLAIPATTISGYETATRHGFFLTSAATGTNFSSASFTV